METVLIIDDQIDIVRLVAAKLTEKKSYKVINANSGKIGIEIAKEQQPDIIIMDWDMPVMNGLEATRLLKNDDETFDIPVIIATGQMTSSEDLQMALASGAVDYLRKPIDFVELEARINTAIRIREQSRSIQELLKSEIELKNRKLSTTSMLIVEKNGMLQDIDQNIKEIEQKIDASPEGAIYLAKQLRKRLQSHLEIDNSWETFRMHFDEVHPDFFAGLNSRYKKLSHKDLKLAAYLKLGMDNKQIARLLNIAPSSTRTALTRLKQKMGIPEDENLRSLIQDMM